MTISTNQLHILRHSLGYDDDGKLKGGARESYRNRFVTGPECDDFAQCSALVVSGHLFDHGPQSGMGGMHYFIVTALGISVVKQMEPPPPKLTRSQQRWQRYRGSADAFLSFRHFLQYETEQARRIA